MKIGDPPPPRQKPRRSEDNRRIVGYEITAQQRQMVVMLKGIGADDETIALQVGVSKSTLRRHFPNELKTGRNWLAGRLGIQAVNMAMNGDRSMLIFVLKTQFGWKESGRVEHTGANGGAIQLENLTTEQLRSLLNTTGENSTSSSSPS